MTSCPLKNQPVESSSSSPKWYQIREIIALYVGVKKEYMQLPSLKLTVRPYQEAIPKGSTSSNHPLRCELLVSGRVTFVITSVFLAGLNYNSSNHLFIPLLFLVSSFLKKKPTRKNAAHAPSPVPSSVPHTHTHTHTHTQTTKERRFGHHTAQQTLTHPRGFHVLRRQLYHLGGRRTTELL